MLIQWKQGKICGVHSSSKEMHLNFVGTRTCGLQRVKILFMFLINPQYSTSAGAKGQVASRNGNLIHWLLLLSLWKAAGKWGTDMWETSFRNCHKPPGNFFLANKIILGMQEMIIAYLQKTAAFSIPKSICRYLLQIKCLGAYVPLWL